MDTEVVISDINYIESLAFELEIEGFFPSFNSLEFLSKYKKNRINDYEFELFIKQLTYSRYLRDKKIDNQLMTNQYITNLVRSFKK